MPNYGAMAGPSGHFKNCSFQHTEPTLASAFSFYELIFENCDFSDVGGSSEPPVEIVAGGVMASFQNCTFGTTRLQFAESRIDEQCYGLYPYFSIDITDCDINEQVVTTPFGGQ